MRVLYHSAVPWASTGYGRVTEEVAGRMHNGEHDIAIQSMNAIKDGVMQYHGEHLSYDLESPMTIYPTKEDGMRKMFGLSNVVSHFNDFDADLYFTHFDTWMDVARRNIPEFEIPYTSYIIVDHWPVPDAVISQIMNAERVITMSKFAHNELKARGVYSKYIPHGINPDNYYPLKEKHKPKAIEVKTDSGDMKRRSVDDVFMFGMVAANHGDRKNIPAHMEAFKMFLDEVTEDAILYIHTEVNSKAGFDLDKIRQRVGVPKEKLIFSRGSDYGEVGDEFLNAWYNTFDVFLNCSMGESWGLTITEAQCAGTPAVVTNFSSMPEQLGAPLSRGVSEDYWSATIKHSISDNVHAVENGIVVDPNSNVWREKVNSKQYKAAPEDIKTAMEYYYHNPQVREDHGEQAAEYVRDNYTWENHVIPEFESLFNSIERELV